MDDNTALPKTVADAFDRLYDESLASRATKREMFAAMAMQGLCAAAGRGSLRFRFEIDEVAETSVKIADALIADLAKVKED